MQHSYSPNPQVSPPSPAPPEEKGFAAWRQLKNQRISYLSLPLILMATMVEFVILATGWKYQQVVCVPQGMGVVFFGIGPIGATILAVELLKLPLAVWTASRVGWQKMFMVMFGLPLICVLTFQLVKDMAVYEMGTAMAPASQFLEKAAVEEVKMLQLNNELGNQTKDLDAVKAAIAAKKAERDRKLAELAAKQAKTKAELEESLKRNDATREDAINLTDFQKKELAEAEARQTTIIKQFDADAAQLSKAIAELRARRETELTRATTWNAEEARIENEYKAKLSEYTNKKKAYEKDKAEYYSANVLKRQLLREPVDPGVPPVREANKILKPTLVSEIEAQINSKEAELVAVNNKRRDRVGQVDADARRLREDYNRRSGSKREETDRKREEFLAAIAQLTKEGAAEAKAIDQEFAASVKKEEEALKNQRPLDAIRAELDASRKTANGYYEAREAAIRKTQVHRIATTVEIVRGWLFGERPVSITASPKERGDLLTDQISMVRIWVYPVLAFIVAFLPTLMVEIGVSTLFKPEQQRPAYRVGFFGRGLHWLYIRAGRHKILRAERKAREVSAELAAREKALALANAAAEQQGHQWNTKVAELTASLHHTVTERNALRDFQQAEVERQVQSRQNEWSERLTRMRQELDAQRSAAEAERAALAQEHHKKLLEVSADWKNQVSDARRQLTDAEFVAEEKMGRLAAELKQALEAREAACTQLQDAAREMDKAARQEKERLDRQQMEFGKTRRQLQDEFEHQLKEREQELTLSYENRWEEERTRAEEAARRREEEFARELETQTRAVDARWSQEVRRREDAAQVRLKQREQQLSSEAEVALRTVQTQADEQARRREIEFQRQLDARSREAEKALREGLQQQELAFHARLKQSEQALKSKAAARETELQNQWQADLRTREQEWEQKAESRIRAAEIRLAHDVQQQEESSQLKVHQREQQLRAQFDARQAELQAQWEQQVRQHDAEAAEARQREQALAFKLNQQAEAHQLAEQDWARELETMRTNIEPFKALLARTEKERDDARQSAADSFRQREDLEKKLMEASSFLSGWRNGKSAAA
jgi:hypothetical protein